MCVSTRLGLHTLFLTWVLNVPDRVILLELILSQCLYFLQNFLSPPAGSEVLKLKGVIGYNGNGRGNMVWNPDTGTTGKALEGREVCVPSQGYDLVAVGLGSSL